MSETRSFCNNASGPSLYGRDNVCIDTKRILDSCRDRDCFEDTKVLLTDFGQEMIEKASSLRVKDTKVVCSDIILDPIQFNKGFYQITVRLYTKLCIEACICLGKTQEIEGVAVTEKKVVLFGGEGNVRIFKSNPTGDFCAPCISADNESYGNPEVVVETVDPIALSVKVVDPCKCAPVNCCTLCCACDMPKVVHSCLNGSLTDYRNGDRELLVSLGFFSVIRIQRPTQLVVSASEYCIPDKECIMADEEDPCSIFSKMAFPISEFCPSQTPSSNHPISVCDCKKSR
ncbi:MAG: hypothetical protein J6R60_03265 [Clostridia bacterium]|nr:hypothetical protein [Clostridia bacterium]